MGKKGAIRKVAHSVRGRYNLRMDVFVVTISKRAKQSLKKLPAHIVDKLQLWVDMIENEGLRESRKIKSFHDEMLQGNRKGQRSVRLNSAYRAIYIERADKSIEFIELLEVNKHDY